MTQTWLVVRTPDGVYTWDLTGRDPEEIPELVLRARVLTGFPCGDDWNFADERVYDIAITSGEPHPDLGAIVAELGALDAVAVDRVDACRGGCQRHAEAAQIAAAERTLAALSDEQIDQIIARRQSASTTVRGGTDGNTGIRTVGSRG